MVSFSIIFDRNSNYYNIINYIEWKQKEYNFYYHLKTDFHHHFMNCPLCTVTESLFSVDADGNLLACKMCGYKIKRENIPKNNNDKVK